ncbi:uncharacterized protein MONBRDRAFT_33035 [Monosiga brevicollis MX1]|uniref:5'-nucleotidase domain-containing protein n=1 Tax=Monosiga brevicollis TaxID=81824 RepID=A9V354_MONBE|nr:uncharacterized protein MONBRDRAFT_33035 [Monosiga brevicollis MX1]EDQ88001.1 predicted protein [Monosiga brevicollis MX1]|eukprot:XP_001747077.1 hypothetical protein [Monosiga brevicollis MX1]
MPPVIDTTAPGAWAAGELLHLHACDWLGFDLDHCLLRYNVPALAELLHSAFLRFLVDNRGYPARLLDIPMNPSFFIKGLLFDTERGVFLRLRNDGTVFAATHGTAPLAAAAAEALYRPGELQDVVRRVLTNGERDRRFTWFSTFFDMPAACVVAELITAMDTARANIANIESLTAAAAATTGPTDRAQPDAELRLATITYTEMMQDVFAALSGNFDIEHFANNSGYFFPALRQDPARYLHKFSSDLRRWLYDLRHRDGVKLFLLTNSHIDYVHFLLSHAYGAAWPELFDLVLTSGNKPAFFHHQEPFRHVSIDGKVGEPAALRLGSTHYYVGGNARELEQLLQRHRRDITNHSALDVVYFGDHITGDVLASSHHMSWRSVAVVEELLLHVWGALFYGTARVEPCDTCFMLYEELLRRHSTLVVPHLDALAEHDRQHVGHPAVGPGGFEDGGLVIPTYGGRLEPTSRLQSLNASVESRADLALED